LTESKREKLMRKIENHLRKTARHLVKIDTEEEALQFLADSFRSQFSCDFVGIILQEGEELSLKVWSGDLQQITESFPLQVQNCSPNLLHQSLTYDKAEQAGDCQFTNLMKKEKVKTWFTVPLKDDMSSLGFCIIAYLDYVPLLDMKAHFDEFGKDVAVAIAMAKQKEAQIKKIEGIEWISKNLSLDVPLEKNIETLVERAGKGTNARMACIYLYNEKENHFIFQPPSYGPFEKPERINIETNYVLKEYFPYLDTPGGSELTVPLIFDLKTIGVLHVEGKQKGVFNEDDLEILKLLSNHIAAILENARLYKNEKEHKERLSFLLDYQHALVKETVEHDNFDGITSALRSLFSKSVLLFDRFMRPISCSFHHYDLSNKDVERLMSSGNKERLIENGRKIHIQLDDGEELHFRLWKVNGGGNLLGFLAVEIGENDMDEFDQLTIDLARNICSIQFIKQKLVLDTKEQVKDSFVSKLLVERIEDQERILQYANLFQWNLFHQHRLAVLSILLDKKETENSNLLVQQSKKTLIWDQLKTQISRFSKEIIMATNDGNYILIVPVKVEGKHPKNYWREFYRNIKNWVREGNIECQVFMGIGGKTENLNDYYISYQQAIQALNVVFHRFRQKGFALFEELGAYTILHHLDNKEAVEFFIKRHLEPLLNYSEGKSMDLFHTLRVFLYNNGNIKNSAEELFIHRSSLLYRLEKIESLLEIDLNDADHRFNMMMAYKLYDLYYSKTTERI
jgi:Regulator of polyketide synthase expression